MPRTYITGIRTIVLITFMVLLLVGCKMEVEATPEGRIVGKATFANTESHIGIVVSLEQVDRHMVQNIARATTGNLPDLSTRVLKDQTTTDAAGAYRFESVPEGFYIVYATSKDSAEHAAYTSVQVIEGRETTAPDLSLTAVGHIAGKVVLDDNETGNIGFIVFIAGTSYMAITDDKGDFTISSVPSDTDYEIVIMRNSDTFQWATDVTVAAGSTTDLGTLGLSSDDFPGILSITWKGELAAAPADPTRYWAYHDTEDGNSYIFNGETWDLLARAGEGGDDGIPGAAGADGISIVWKGERATAPVSPQRNWAYYDSTDGKSYIYDGTDWHILAENGSSAVWVRYAGNEADSGSVPDIEFLYPGDAITIQDNVGNLTRTGHTFSGWNTKADGSGTDHGIGSSCVVDAGMILYAKWTANTYVVVFDSQGGTPDPADMTVTFDRQYGNLPLIERTGYTFDGWYTGADGAGNLVLDGTTVTIPSDHTLHAKWTADTYAVTFDSHGGTTDPADMTVTFDRQYGNLPSVERTGYDFDGWYTGADGTGGLVLDETTVIIPSDHTLHARWTAGTYTITLDTQEGTGGTGSVIVAYDSPLPEATAPGQLHYKFAGYFDGKDGTGTQYYTSTMASACNWNKAQDTRLYAKWESYQLGDRGPAGGYIFYDDAVGYDQDGNGTIDSDERDYLDDVHDYVLDGERYLEAAPWGWYDGFEDPRFIFGYHRVDGTFAQVGTGTMVSLGQWNTMMLANTMKDKAYVAPGDDTTTTNYAAKICEDHIGGGYDDWFLPSKDELNLMHQRLKMQGIGDFSPYIYWSSSESNEYVGRYAWNQSFATTGSQYNNERNYEYRVRPVRAF